MRTVFTVGLVALAGWIALKVVFGVAGGLIGVLLSLAWLALKVLLAVGVIYWLLSVFSPETARRMRETFKGSNPS